MMQSLSVVPFLSWSQPCLRGDVSCQDGASVLSEADEGLVRLSNVCDLARLRPRMDVFKLQLTCAGEVRAACIVGQRDEGGSYLPANGNCGRPSG